MDIQNIYFPHRSVLLKECLHLLAYSEPEDEELFFADLTFGAGGHSCALAQQNALHKIISLDQDPEAIANGMHVLQALKLQDQIQLFHKNFRDFPKMIKEERKDIFDVHGGFQGILMDLGVSSHHFDSFDRGFSFKENAYLDMRMNKDDSSLSTAAELLGTLSEEELADIFFIYGEERFARRIAKLVVEKRKLSPIDHTRAFAELIVSCYPHKFRYSKTHPATRCFQALRIAVNEELDILKEVLPTLFNLLRPGGRLAVISFHSLEDRIVKHDFKKIFKNNEEHSRILTKRPIIPDEEEIKENNRSRSAKLRVIEKI